MNVARLARVAREEINGLRVGLQLAIAVSGALPDLHANRLRTACFRMAGVAIGRATVIGGHLTIAGAGRAERRVTVGRRGWINAGCYLDASDVIRIGDDVALAQQVIVLTQTHEMGDGDRRAGALRTGPVTIEDGCWLGARVVVLPGVTVGRGAVVAAGAVVTRDVPPNTLVAGVPAKVMRELP